MKRLLTVQVAKILRSVRRQNKKGQENVTLVFFSEEPIVYSTSTEDATEPASVTFRIGENQEVDGLVLHLPGDGRYELRYSQVRIRKSRRGGWIVEVEFTC